MAKVRKRIRQRKPHPNPIRVSKAFNKLILEIKARHMLAGKKPPSTSRITDIIAKKIKKEDLLTNEFIRF